MLLLLLVFSLNQAQIIFPKISNNACTKLQDYPIKSISENCYRNPSVGVDTPNLILLNNYPLETYTAITKDGYILTLFRIPPKNNDNRKKKQPIFIQHGLALDSSIWVDIGKRSLAFNLADQGYDVWLGSQRGTKFSRYNTDSKKSTFDVWNYNLDDLAMYDIKACLEKVAKVTNQPGSIIYIGYSRGTTIMFMFASNYPEDAKQLLKGIVALSPVVYFDDAWGPRFVLQSATIVVEIFKFFRIPAIFYPSDLIHRLALSLCTSLPIPCFRFIEQLVGNTGQFPPDDLLNFYSRIPEVVSFNEYLHYSQISRSGNFQKFDFGKNKNLQKYGQVKPPVYNLRNIELPVYMYYGKNDDILSTPAVERIYKELGSTTKMLKSVPIDNTTPKYQFNHIDFIFSKFIREFLYEDLFVVLKELAL